MSLKYMVKAMDTRVGNSIRKLVLIKLADNANDEGYCWPSHQNVADICEIGHSTARKHISVLEEQGYVLIENRKGPKGNMSNRYKLQFPPIPPETATDDCSDNSPPMPPDSAAPVPPDGTPMPLDSTPPVPPGSTGICHSFEPVNEPVKEIPEGSQSDDSTSLMSDRLGKLKPKTVDDDLWTQFTDRVDPDHLRDWLAYRKARRSPVSPTVIKAMQREAAKANLTIAQAVQICAERPWIGFKAEYLDNPRSQQAGAAKRPRLVPKNSTGFGSAEDL